MTGVAEQGATKAGEVDWQSIPEALHKAPWHQAKEEPTTISNLLVVWATTTDACGHQRRGDMSRRWLVPGHEVNMSNLVPQSFQVWFKAKLNIQNSAAPYNFVWPLDWRIPLVGFVTMAFDCSSVFQQHWWVYCCCGKAIVGSWRCVGVFVGCYNHDTNIMIPVLIL